MDLFLSGLSIGIVLGAASCFLWLSRDRPGRIAEWEEETYRPAPPPIERPIAVTRLTNRRRTVEL